MPTEGTGHPSDLDLHLKILTPKQIFQRLATALTQLKTGKTFENLLLNEIRQIMHT